MPRPAPIPQVGTSLEAARKPQDGADLPALPRNRAQSRANASHARSIYDYNPYHRRMTVLRLRSEEPSSLGIGKDDDPLRLTRDGRCETCLLYTSPSPRDG